MKTMTDEKMIEELAKDIFESKVAIDGSDMAFGLFDEDDHFHRIARFLYKHNYRKLPENAVVIPEKINEETSPEDIIKIAKYNESVRKKTAREIFDAIIKALEERKESVEAFYGVPESVGVDVAIRKIKQLAKRYGVEVE